MTDPRTNGVSFRTLALTVGALVVAFAGWSYRAEIAERFKSAPAVAAVPVIVQTECKLPDGFKLEATYLPLFVKDVTNYAEVTGKDGKVYRVINWTVYPGLVVPCNEAESGEWNCIDAARVRRLGPIKETVE